MTWATHWHRCICVLAGASGSAHQQKGQTMGTHEAEVIAHIAGLSAGGLGKVAHSIESALDAARCADDAEALGIMELEMMANGEQWEDQE